MAKVTFHTDHKTIEVVSGTSLQEAVDQAQASLPFGCRLGSCGTCRCFIVKGEQNLNAKTQSEQDLFATLTAVAVNERLACQCLIYGDVEITA